MSNPTKQTRSLYSNTKQQNQNTSFTTTSTSRDPVTGKNIDKMTTEDFQKGILQYEDKIDNKRDDILATLRETKNISNAVGNELNENSESIERINNELDELDHKLNTSEYLVQRFASWFSFFTKPKTMPARTMTGSEVKIKTRFEATNVNTKYKKTNKNEYEAKTEEDIEKEKKQKEDEFYDEVSDLLDNLNKDASIFGKIMGEHSEVLDVTGSKMDKSDGRIKKTIDKVKHSG